LQLVASNNEWFVQVYQVKADYNVIYASSCQDCFSVFNVNNDYHIFVAGVNADAEPNPAVQFHNWIAYERSQDYAVNLQGFVDDVYSTYCVFGVTAVLNSVKSSVLFPVNWASTGYVYVKDNFKFLVWAVKDNCPGW
jgi:hypothetical protein